MASYAPIQTIKLASAAASVTFSGIDQTFTDLIIVANIKADSTTVVSPGLRFNGDSSSNYSANWLYGTGSGVAANRAGSTSMIYTGDYAAGVTSAYFQTFTSHIMNYSNATSYKTVLSRNVQLAAAAGETGATTGLWRNNSSAINSVTYTSSTGYSFAAGSTFSLYGVGASNAKISSASGGTGIYYDSTYAYHVFTGTGTFTPNRSLTADILVVAGGGGGGAGTNASNGGGGGGAGGLLAFTSQSLTAQSYTVTVGAGGTGNGSSAVSSNGNDSRFGALTLVKGGGAGGSNYAGSSSNWPGSNGGSGGGGYGRLAAGGSPTSAQGYAGGTGGADSGNYSGAGGGGAGAVGANGNSSSTAGAGGIGLYSTLTDAIGAATSTGQLVSSHYYFAGGGGGGSWSSTAASGGSGGGGAGGSSTAVATSGLTNMGGGGGASGGSSTGAGTGKNGGSGIVIVRYAR